MMKAEILKLKQKYTISEIRSLYESLQDGLLADMIKLCQDEIVYKILHTNSENKEALSSLKRQYDLIFYIKQNFEYILKTMMSGGEM